MCDCLDRQTDTLANNTALPSQSRQRRVSATPGKMETLEAMLPLLPSQGLLNLPSFKIRTAFHGRKMLCS